MGSVLGSDRTTIKLNSDVTGALAGLALVAHQMKVLDGQVKASTASIVSSSTLMKTTMVGMGVAMAGLTVGAAASIQTFAKWEQAVANAASVTGDTGEAYDATRKNIEAMSRELGSTTVFSAQEAATAIYDLASAGYAVGDMVANDMEPILALAAATQMDLGRTTHWVTSTLGQFQLGIEDSAYVADVFAKTISSSKATLEKLGLSMVYAGQIGSDFGTSMEEVNAALAIMYNRGQRGEQAGRALRTMFNRLSAPTTAVKKNLAELGIGLDEVNPKFHSLQEILKRLSESDFDISEAGITFGAEAQAAGGALVGSYEEYLDMLELIQDSSGAAQEMAIKQLDTVQGAFTLLSSIITDLKIEIGEELMPAVRDALRGMYAWTTVARNSVGPAFEYIRTVIRALEPTWIALNSIVDDAGYMFRYFMLLLPDGIITLQNVAAVVNTVATSIALMFQYMREHQDFLKLVVLGLTIAAAYSILAPIVMALGAAYAFVTGGMLAYTAGTIAAAIATYGLAGAIALVVSPLTLVAALLAVIAAAWILDVGGMREITADFAVGTVHAFIWMVDESVKLFNVLATEINKVRAKIGTEPIIPLEFDSATAEKNIFGLVDGVKQGLSDFNLGDYLDTDLDIMNVDNLLEAQTIVDDMNETLISMSENEVFGVPDVPEGFYAAQNIKEREMLGRVTAQGTSSAEPGAVLQAGGKHQTYEFYIENLRMSEDAEGEGLEATVVDAVKTTGG